MKVLYSVRNILALLAVFFLTVDACHAASCVAKPPAQPLNYSSMFYDSWSEDLHEHLPYTFQTGSIAVPHLDPKKMMDAMIASGSKVNRNFSFVIAHRGFHSEPGCPENSACSLAEAYRAGADGVEYDIKILGDTSVGFGHDYAVGRELVSWGGKFVGNPVWSPFGGTSVNKGSNTTSYGAVTTFAYPGVDPAYADTSSPFGTKAVARCNPYNQRRALLSKDDAIGWPMMDPYNQPTAVESLDLMVFFTLVQKYYPMSVWLDVKSWNDLAATVPVITAAQADTGTFPTTGPIFNIGLKYSLGARLGTEDEDANENPTGVFSAQHPIEGSGSPTAGLHLHYFLVIGTGDLDQLLRYANANSISGASNAEKVTNALNNICTAADGCVGVEIAHKYQGAPTQAVFDLLRAGNTEVAAFQPIPQYEWYWQALTPQEQHDSYGAWAPRTDASCCFSLLQPTLLNSSASFTDAATGGHQETGDSRSDYTWNEQGFTTITTDEPSRVLKDLYAMGKRSQTTVASLAAAGTQQLQSGGSDVGVVRDGLYAIVERDTHRPIEAGLWGTDDDTLALGETLAYKPTQLWYIHFEGLQIIPLPDDFDDFTYAPGYRLTNATMVTDSAGVVTPGASLTMMAPQFNNSLCTPICYVQGAPMVYDPTQVFDINLVPLDDGSYALHGLAYGWGRLGVDDGESAGDHPSIILTPLGSPDAKEWLLLPVLPPTDVLVASSSPDTPGAPLGINTEVENPRTGRELIVNWMPPAYMGNSDLGAGLTYNVSIKDANTQAVIDSATQVSDTFASFGLPTVADIQVEVSAHNTLSGDTGPTSILKAHVSAGGFHLDSLPGVPAAGDGDQDAEGDGNGMTLCATEGQTCSFTGDALVALGADGQFLYTRATNGFSCTVSAFGGDPLNGVVKSCYYRLAAPPTGYTWCADQNGSCTFSGGPTTVAFGDIGSYTYFTLASGATCNSASFRNADPLPGVLKACFAAPQSAAMSAGPAGFTWCASENGQCAFTGKAAVVFGGDTLHLSSFQMVDGSIADGITCDIAHFGGIDPDLNVVKSCYFAAAPAGVTGMPNYCGLEGSTCSVPEEATVYFGTGGNWAVKQNVTSSTPCTNSAFGVDPSPGDHKVCFYVTQTSITLASSTNPAITGTNVTFTANVGPLDKSAGEVTFSDTFNSVSTTLDTVEVNGGVAVYSTGALAAGSHLITAAFNSTAGYESASASLTETLSTPDSTLVFVQSISPNSVSPGLPIHLQADVVDITAGGSPTNGTVTFYDVVGGSTINAGATSVIGNGGLTSAILYTPSGAGTHTIIATFTPYNLLAYTTSSDFTGQNFIVLSAQSIFFQPPASPANGSQVTLTATANSGLPVTYTVTSGPATVSGSTLTITGIGAVTVTANQAGNAYYSPARPASITMVTIAAATAYAAPATSMGSSSATQTAIVTFTGNATLNATTATAIQVLTQGAANKDFTYAAGGTCAAGASYVAGQACTVNYVFSPTAPGVRKGAVTLNDGSGAPVVRSFLNGVGNGPLGLFRSGTLALLSTSFSNAKSVAVDGAENLYVADQSAETISKVAPNGTVTVLVSGINIATGVAVDGAGDVFYGAYGEGKVYELIGGTGTPQLVASIASPDIGMAVDAAGNIYIGSGAGAVRIDAVTHSTTVLSSVPGSVPAVAVDGNGNVYFPDFNNNKVYTIPAGTTTQTLIASTGLNGPRGMAVDAAGNIYVANQPGASIVKLAAGTYAQTTVATGYGFNALTMDGNGDLWSGVATRVVALQRRIPPTVTFPNTAVAATSAQTIVTLENDGNSALSITAVAASANFNLNGAGTGCTSSTVLAVNANCSLGIQFAPTVSGVLTGSANITDNTFGVAGAVQSVPLSGTGTP